jgi:hypothetical protein
VHAANNILQVFCWMRSSKLRESRETTLGATIEMPFRALGTTNNSMYGETTVVYGSVDRARKEPPAASSTSCLSKHQAMELVADTDAGDDDLRYIPHVI